MTIIFQHNANKTKKYTIYVKRRNIEVRVGYDIINKLLESFLENYEREENILRNGSHYGFDCVDHTLVQFHTIELKRGSSYIPSTKWISDINSDN